MTSSRSGRLEAAIAVTDRLEDLLRDLLSLLALPALWVGRTPHEILSMLFESLEGLLRIEIAYAVVRAERADADPELEILRLGGREASDRLGELRPGLDPVVAQTSPRAMRVDLGSAGAFRVVSSPLSYFAIRGTLVVGSSREAFPDHREALIVQTATTLVATALQTAQAIREREKAARAKDEFLAMLGHELRNPLAPIVTALELIRLRGEAPAERELEIIRRQVGHLGRLVDDLLDISRITQGRIELQPQPVEIAEVVANAIEASQALVSSRGHRLEVDVPARGLLVRGDPARLTQVIANLVNNAAKYTPRGGQIRVGGASEGGNVVLRVEDDGIGLDPHLLPHVFELFHQGPAKNLASREGLGLGLAIVKNLVGLHGGEVAAESAGPGLGSTFVVRLPRLGAAGLPEVIGADAAPAVDLRRSERVLLIEDNPDTLAVLKRVLVAVGHQVSAATSGIEALGRAAAFRPTVVVTDIGLPGIDGYELSERLRGKLGDAMPPVIALTGFGQSGDRERSERAGFFRHLVKPVGIQALLEAIREAGNINAR